MTAAATSEERLLARLRAGEETAFRELVTRHDRAMKRIALTFVRSSSVADEVVQETWLAVIKGLDRFEGRSSLKTWIFRILANRAQSRGAREQRTTPFSSLAPSDERRADGRSGPVPAGGGRRGRLLERDAEPVLRASRGPHARGGDLRARGGRNRELPRRQQQVIRLRDVEGWGAEEVCESLELSAANQRVLLHRARSAVRASLEEYFTEVVSV